MPLADILRPQTLNDVVGQLHLLGENKPLRAIANSGQLANLIFYGPSGVGKTTVARIMAQTAKKKLFKLNGTTTSTADIKSVVEELDTLEGVGGIVLYLDEIQYLNKKQQQTLLEFIENGRITLIASTTENPYFYIYNAILSRCTVFEFKPVEPSEIESVIRRAFNHLGVTPKDDVVKYIATSCGGDVRKAINATEILNMTGKIDLENAKEVSQKSSMRYDRDGDEHYDILSAFQKSIRGSDENAALHYLARLVHAGDLLSICRRLLVISSEDIGLAYPTAITVVKSCVDSAIQLGLPEARIPLAQAVILLCTSPKSNSAITAIEMALDDIRNGDVGNVPEHLRDSHYPGANKRTLEYKYPHNYPNGYVKQQYLPDRLKDKVYYRFGENKTEQAAKSYRIKIEPQSLW